MRGRGARAIMLGCVMLLMPVSAAYADAIDGNWCHPDGRRLAIRGPEIVTPGGVSMRGDYTRHSFAYVVPSGEPGPGETVSMILLSEYLMHSRQGGNEAPVQAWNRCPPDISMLPRPGERGWSIFRRKLVPDAIGDGHRFSQEDATKHQRPDRFPIRGQAMVRPDRHPPAPAWV